MFLHCEIRHIQSKFCQPRLILSSFAISTIRSSHWRCSVKKDVPKNFENFKGKHLCWGIFLIKWQALSPATLLKRDSTQVFSCEICEIFKNTYFKEHLRMTACKRYELEVSFNFVKKPFCGNSSQTPCLVVIHLVSCKILSGKWDLKMNGQGICWVTINAGGRVVMPCYLCKCVSSPDSCNMILLCRFPSQGSLRLPRNTLGRVKL